MSKNLNKKLYKTDQIKQVEWFLFKYFIVYEKRLRDLLKRVKFEHKSPDLWDLVFKNSNDGSYALKFASHIISHGINDLFGIKVERMTLKEPCKVVYANVDPYELYTILKLKGML